MPRKSKRKTPSAEDEQINENNSLDIIEEKVVEQDKNKNNTNIEEKQNSTYNPPTIKNHRLRCQKSEIKIDKDAESLDIEAEEQPQLILVQDREVVDLSLGDRNFTTFKSTLTKYPSSYIEQFFSGKTSEVPVKDKDGRYLIDRPAEPFLSVLNFLRTEKIFLPDSSLQLNLLQKELEHWGLTPHINITKSNKWKGYEGTAIPLDNTETKKIVPKKKM